MKVCPEMNDEEFNAFMNSCFPPDPNVGKVCPKCGNVMGRLHSCTIQCVCGVTFNSREEATAHMCERKRAFMAQVSWRKFVANAMQAISHRIQ